MQYEEAINKNYNIHLKQKLITENQKMVSLYASPKVSLHVHEPKENKVDSMSNKRLRSFHTQFKKKVDNSQFNAGEAA